jgi:hypothetical protein
MITSNSFMVRHIGSYRKSPSSRAAQCCRINMIGWAWSSTRWRLLSDVLQLTKRRGPLASSSRDMRYLPE